MGALPDQTQYRAVVEWLLLNKVRKSHRDVAGRTAMDIAVECGRKDLAELILASQSAEAGASSELAAGAIVV